MVPVKNYTQLELMQARLKQVPDDWVLSYVGRAFNIRNNFRKPISEDERSKQKGTYPYYGPTKVQGYIGTYEQDGSYALIGEDGDHFLKFSSQSMTQLIDGKCTVNNHAHIIEGTGKATREWFYYYFMHRDILNFLSRQGAGRYKLNKATLEKVPLVLPPLFEQKKIAQILATWDKAIATTEQLLANSQQQKKALMHLLFNCNKRFPGHVAAWESNLLGEIIRFTKGVQINKSTLSEFGEHPVINGGVTPSGYTVDFNTPGNTITISEGGNSCGHVAFQSENFWCGGHCYAIKETKLNLAFTYQILKANERKIMGLRVGSGLPNIQKKALESFALSYPLDESEQKKIASVLSASDKETTVLKQKLSHLKQEKKALMQQLLTGKRRVKMEAV